MNDGDMYVGTLRELRVQRRRNLEKAVLLRRRIAERYGSIKEQLTLMALVSDKIKDLLPFVRKLFFGK
jgi:hypothetical protein